MSRHWRCYEITPIDLYWENLQTIEEVCAAITTNEVLFMLGKVPSRNGLELTDFLRDFKQALELARSKDWEGSYRKGEEPRVFWLPDEVAFKYAFVWKQENNGTTYVVSPHPLPWLDKFVI